MYGKILIQCDLIVRTGMHIGASGAFSAIGAVDSPVIRDTLTCDPIIPGSSLKGKLRTLLARSICGDITKMPDFNDDDAHILRLFGSAQPVVKAARLQFADCFVNNKEKMKAVGLTEVKFENTIDRRDSRATPRQIERVVPGTSFGVNIVYEFCGDDEAKEDLALLAKGMKLLQLDYLGGHGSRGSGRVSFTNFRLSAVAGDTDTTVLESLFREVAAYELFSV